MISILSLRRRTRRLCFALIAAMLIAINAIAYLHARAMTHFVATGVRTDRPEALTRLQKLRVLLTGITLPRPVNHATPADLGLAFDTHRFASVDGLSLEAWYVARNQSKGIVIECPGYAGAKDSLLPEAREFHDLGYDVLLLDFRGCGGSQGDETTIGVKEADDVAAAVADARRSVPASPIILYGESMGAAAILRCIAVNGAAPDAVIVECPFDRLLSTVENRFHSMHLPAFPMARLLVFWGGLRQGYWAFAHNPIDYAAAVRCPVLFMHGANDPRVTLAQAQSVYDQLACPKRFAAFPGVGHQPYLSRDPIRWKSEVTWFLGTLH